MSLIQIANWILDQDRFSAFLLIVGALSVARPSKASAPLLLFLAGYFSSQIPLAWFNARLDYHEELSMLSLISFATVLGYRAIGFNKYLLLAAQNEALLAFINLLLIMNAYLAEMRVTSLWHPWWHWAITAIINYVSLCLLLYNRWKHQREHGPRGTLDVVRQMPDFIYSCVKRNRKGKV